MDPQTPAQILCNYLRRSAIGILMSWGARDYMTSGENELRFRVTVTNPRVYHKFVIKYNQSSDLYDLQFGYIKGSEWIELNSADGIDWEALPSVIDRWAQTAHDQS